MGCKLLLHPGDRGPEDKVGAVIQPSALRPVGEPADPEGVGALAQTQPAQERDAESVLVLRRALLRPHHSGRHQAARGSDQGTIRTSDVQTDFRILISVLKNLKGYLPSPLNAHLCCFRYDMLRELVLCTQLTCLLAYLNVFYLVLEITLITNGDVMCECFPRDTGT